MEFVRFLTANGKFTLPEFTRNALGIESGDYIEFYICEEGIAIKKIEVIGFTERKVFKKHNLLIDRIEHDLKDKEYLSNLSSDEAISLINNLMLHVLDQDLK